MDTAKLFEPGQYLTFFIRGEEYAVSIRQTREILEYDTATKVPRTPAWIRGVINLRGSVVPVMDLGVKLGLPDKAPDRKTCVIILDVQLDGEAVTMGVLADTVSQVTELKADDVEHPPTFGTRVRVDYLRGMARRQNRFILVLDIDRIISEDDVLALRAVETGGEDGSVSAVAAPAGAARTTGESGA